MIASTAREITGVKKILAAKFKIKDKELCTTYGLGITVDSQQCIWLHQKQYIFSILVKYKMTEAKIATTQFCIDQLLVACYMLPLPHVQISLMLSKFSSSPIEAHLTAEKRILRYLNKGSAGIAVKYQKSDNGTLMRYSDADWAGDPDNKHSMTGNLFFNDSRTNKLAQ